MRPYFCVCMNVCNVCAFVCYHAYLALKPLTANSLLSSENPQYAEAGRRENQSEEHTYNHHAAASNPPVATNEAFNVQEENEDPGPVNSIHDNACKTPEYIELKEGAAGD